MLLTYLALLIITAAPDDPEPPNLDAQFRSLRDAYQAAHDDFVRANGKAKTPEERAKIASHPGRRPRDFAAGFMDLARKHPGTPAAEDALVWVASQTSLDKASEEAMDRLAKDHPRSPKLAPALGFQGHYKSVYGGAEAFFRTVIAENPHREIQGLARYWLARNLFDRANSSRRFRKMRDAGQTVAERPELAEVYGNDWADRIRRLDPDALDREAITLLGRVVGDYADIPHNDKRRGPGLLGEAAEADLRERNDLAIGKPAPEFTGVDLGGKAWRTVDGRGKVVVLDFGSHFYCGTCRENYPRLREISRRLAGRRFELISINAEPGKSMEELRSAWTSEGNDWRCLFDGSWEGPIQKAWNIQSFPTIYVLDARGLIRHKANHARELDGIVDRLLSESEPGR